MDTASVAVGGARCERRRWRRRGGAREGSGQGHEVRSGETERMYAGDLMVMTNGTVSL